VSGCGFAVHDLDKVFFRAFGSTEIDARGFCFFPVTRPISAIENFADFCAAAKNPIFGVSFGGLSSSTRIGSRFCHALQ